MLKFYLTHHYRGELLQKFLQDDAARTCPPGKELIFVEIIKFLQVVQPRCRNSAGLSHVNGYSLSYLILYLSILLTLYILILLDINKNKSTVLTLKDNHKSLSISVLTCRLTFIKLLSLFSALCSGYFISRWNLRICQLSSLGYIFFILPNSSHSKGFALLY